MADSRGISRWPTPPEKSYGKSTGFPVSWIHLGGNKGSQKDHSTKNFELNINCGERMTIILYQVLSPHKSEEIPSCLLKATQESPDPMTMAAGATAAVLEIVRWFILILCFRPNARIFQIFFFLGRKKVWMKLSPIYRIHRVPDNVQSTYVT